MTLPRPLRALAVIAFSTFVVSTALATLYVGAMTCDESCDGDNPEPGGHWASYSDAWQWELVSWLGAAAFLAGLACAIARVTGRIRAAKALALLYGAVSAAVTALLEQAGDEFIVIGSAGAVACALVMMPPRVASVV